MSDINKTSSGGASLTAESVDEAKLDAQNTPDDGEILSYNSGTGRFEWVADQTGGAGVDLSDGHGLTDSGSGMSTFSDGLTNEEIDRFSLEAGEILEVYRLSAPLDGGGTEANFTLDVYDETNTTVLESVTGGSTSAISSPTAGDTSGSGAEVIVRVSNSSGGVVTASPQYRLNITDAP